MNIFAAKAINLKLTTSKCLEYFLVILIEEGDVDRTLDEIWEGCRLVDIYWEGIMLRGDFFIGIYLADNEYGLCFVIPDAPWVDGELRSLIEDILDPLPEPVESTQGGNP